MPTTNVTVFVRKNNVEKALSIFKKSVKDTGILQQYKDKQEFVKPSIIKRRKKLDAQYKARQDQKKNI